MMKKWLIGLTMTAMMLAGSWSALAAPGGFHRGPGPGPGPGPYHGPGKPVVEPYRQVREDAASILHRTALVMMEAQRAAERGRNSFGMARAVANQQRARELYLAGSYQDAIFHSLRARDLAFQIIQANHGRIGHEFYRDEREERYAHQAPQGNELDLRLNLGKVGGDDAVLHMRFNLDIN